jgi:predicted DNA-binding transcriptional regulator YafY
MGKLGATVPAGPLRWGTERRLEFIEFRLYWDGRVNRADLTREFGISVPQASLDLSRYQQLAPDNMTYDKSVKTYLASPGFRPLFFSPDADAYLNSLRSISDKVLSPDQTWLSRIPEFAALPVPSRRMNAAHLRATLAAIQNKTALHIRYQSMSRPNPTWRWISPHALGFDGFRWHARALCHLDHTYKDFLLARTLDVGDAGPYEGDVSGDRVWNEMVTLRIAPHPQLTPAQRRAVEFDYGMSKGTLELKVRAALTYYVRKLLGLDRKMEAVRPQDQQIILVNDEEVESALRRLTIIPTMQTDGTDVVSSDR